ncbi:hypothetical protein JKP88DRAFT_287476 [Tribonema minus]|uniref:Zn(2)-C6 fungal-type domain-containing protein n=1 Tax=Tribonema minus TaxID=303371 RepID=A0A835ZG81_9STRA|nr:hypothetical protein JKP88DRAFT_287476 [Tribonema minus]
MTVSAAFGSFNTAVVIQERGVVRSIHADTMSLLMLLAASKMQHGEYEEVDPQYSGVEEYAQDATRSAAAISAAAYVAGRAANGALFPRVACDFCHEHHTKCQRAAGRSHCQQCLWHNVECTTTAAAAAVSASAPKRGPAQDTLRPRCAAAAADAATAAEPTRRTRPVTATGAHKRTVKQPLHFDEMYEYGYGYAGGGERGGGGSGSSSSGSGGRAGVLEEQGGAVQGLRKRSRMAPAGGESPGSADEHASARQQRPRWPDALSPTAKACPSCGEQRGGAAGTRCACDDDDSAAGQRCAPLEGSWHRRPDMVVAAGPAESAPVQRSPPPRGAPHDRGAKRSYTRHFDNKYTGVYSASGGGAAYAQLTVGSTVDGTRKVLHFPRCQTHEEAAYMRNIAVAKLFPNETARLIQLPPHVHFSLAAHHALEQKVAAHIVKHFPGGAAVSRRRRAPVLEAQEARRALKTKRPARADARAAAAAAAAQMRRPGILSFKHV